MTIKTYELLNKMIDELSESGCSLCYFGDKGNKILGKYSDKLFVVSKNWEKQFNTPKYLNQTILLNWLREWTDLLDKDKEQEFARILGNLIKQKIKEVILNE